MPRRASRPGERSLPACRARGRRAAVCSFSSGTTRLDVSGPAGDLAHYSLDAAQWRLAFSWDKKSDPASSLVEMGARPYDPASGRFLAVDPIVGGSLNTYDYAGQDPINRYDLDGTLTAPCPGRARSYDCAQGSPGLGPKAVAGKAKKI